MLYPSLFDSFFAPTRVIVVSEERLKAAEQSARKEQLEALDNRINELTQYRTSLSKEIQALEPKKVGGLILTEETDVDNRYLKAKVISIGNLVEGIQENDIIYYDKHAGHGIQHKDNFYGVIKQQDVVLID